MNAQIERHYRDVVLLYRELRDELMAVLADEELAFRPGGRNLTLGALCVRLGETQKAYAKSFRTFEAQFVYQPPDATKTGSVAGIRAWYRQLDEDLEAALEDLSDEDVANRLVARGGDHKLPVFLHLDVYREALIVFYGQASIYLRAMGKEPPGKWAHWIWV